MLKNEISCINVSLGFCNLPAFKQIYFRRSRYLVEISNRTEFGNEQFLVQDADILR